VIFYTEKSNLTKTLESFITQFYSLNVIRFYAPFVALVVSIILLAIAFCLSYITLSFIQSHICCSLFLWVISILIFLYFSELCLKNSINSIKIKDEIEANIIIKRKDDALKAIKRRMEIDNPMRKRR